MAPKPNMSSNTMRSVDQRESLSKDTHGEKGPKSSQLDKPKTYQKAVIFEKKNSYNLLKS